MAGVLSGQWGALLVPAPQGAVEVGYVLVLEGCPALDGVMRVRVKARGVKCKHCSLTKGSRL